MSVTSLENRRESMCRLQMMPRSSFYGRKAESISKKEKENREGQINAFRSRGR